MPVIGFHSVILRPDSVKRVIPPTTITPTVNPPHMNSHFETHEGGKSARVNSSSLACDSLAGNTAMPDLYRDERRLG